jgi:hypothetical protein
MVILVEKVSNEEGGLAGGSENFETVEDIRLALQRGFYKETEE